VVTHIGWLRSGDSACRRRPPVHAQSGRFPRPRRQTGSDRRM